MITVALKGGQGNQMFQYALGRALAMRNGDTLRLDLTFLLDRTPRSNFVFRGYDIDVFNTEQRFTLFSRAARTVPLWLVWAGLSAAITFAKNILGIQRYIKERPGMTLESFPKRGNIFLNGHWQSSKYFDVAAPAVRKEFTLREPLSLKEQALADEIARNNSICVNVRRADFVSVARSIEAHGFVGVEYYEKGIAEIKKHVRGDLHIYVFSDEIEWCRENLKFGTIPTTYVGHEYKGKKFEKYLYLMSLAKHFLIPNSTFGWWAAWLSGNDKKVVVAPLQWFKDGRSDADIIPSSWLRI